MVPKKSRKADLESKCFIFFQIGLIISIGLLILAFEWQSPGTSTPGDYNTWNGQFEPEQEVVIRTREKRQIQMIQPLLTIVDNIGSELEEFLPIDNEGGEDISMPVDLFILPGEDNVEDPPIVTNPHEWPSFQGGGLNNFRKYVMQRIRYTEAAAENGISGRVFVQFIVDHRGMVTQVELFKGVHPALDDEAIRVISGSPPWSPGKVGNRAVKVSYILPVNFTLR